MTGKYWAPLFAQGALGRMVSLLLAVLLEGCAGALAPMLVVPNSDICAPVAEGQNCLARGREAFADYYRAKVREILDKSDGYRLPSAPVALIGVHRTEYSVLLVHGLNDSAYYMADLGEVLNRIGFNVITVLLPGHGTNEEDMLEVTAEQWRAEVDRGFDMAALVGNKVLLGGFSLGSALAIDAFARRSDIHGLLLFSPAIKLRSFDAIAPVTCIPGLRSYIVETDLPQNPVKYKFRSGNGICQLSRLMKHNLERANADTYARVAASDELRALARRVNVPTFVAFSYSDRRISAEAALELAGGIQAPVLVATFGTPDDRNVPMLANGQPVRSITGAGLPHSYIVRRNNPFNGQDDPCFDRLASVLIGFLADHFHAKVDAGDRGYPDCRPGGEVQNGPD